MYETASYFFLCCICFVFLARHFSPRGAAGSVTLRLRYLLFPHLPPRRAGGLREIFGMTSHCLSACVPLHFDEGLPCHSAFFCRLFAVEPFLSRPPLPHRRYAASF